MRIFRWTALVALVALVAGGLALWVAGYRMYVIHTGSMDPTLSPGDLVVDGPAGHYRPGEIITFDHPGPGGAVVTHRLQAVSNGLVETKGDANRTADPWQVRPGQIRGRVVLHVPYAGFLAVYFKQPAGIASLVVGTLAMVLLWQIFFGGGTPGTASGEARMEPCPRNRSTFATPT